SPPPRRAGNWSATRGRPGLPFYECLWLTTKTCLRKIGDFPIRAPCKLHLRQRRIYRNWTLGINIRVVDAYNGGSKWNRIPVMNEPTTKKTGGVPSNYAIILAGQFFFPVQIIAMLFARKRRHEA